jgi:ABC-type branched-subunit amino acid transport system substrate-binding protein
MAILAASSAAAQSASDPIEIAVSLPLTGDGSTTFGQGTLQGIQFAIDEANAAAGRNRPIKLAVYDDQQSDKAVTEVAEKIIASRAVLVIGPSYSTASLAQGPLYAKVGLASLCPTATSDAITENATTFRMIFKNSQEGEALATYFTRVLGGHGADVIVTDNKYGQTLRTGFEEAAQRLGIDTKWLIYTTADEADAIANKLGGDHSGRATVFLTLDGDAARILTTLRQLGRSGPFLGGDALGDEGFGALFSAEIQEQRQPGFFTDGLYAVTPMMIDSANAETLAFAERFRARYGHDPIWMTVAGYDAARMAVAAVRAVTNGANAKSDLKAQRAATVGWLAAQTSLEKALPGLLGPLRFDANRGGHRPIRIGRFFQGRFESAPLQIVPAGKPDRAEIEAGSVFETKTEGWARMQRVVYSGMFLNEIARLDVAQSTFAADLYIWMRFAKIDAAEADPTLIAFPNLIRGNFDPDKPAAQGELDDGTIYRLWRVHGDFKNDFDLHRYPADRQSLSIQFFNARAPSDRLVYVRDQRSDSATGAGAATAAIESAASAATPPVEAALGDSATPQAFRNLTQWVPVHAAQGRDTLLTSSALGDPRLVGVERVRELSGFGLSVELHRRVLSTMAKTMLPLGLMATIMFASLFFPTALVKEKVTVAITAALSGAVLLTSINSQLGNVGYVMAVEYVFYIFFALCLLCIVAVLAAERLRAASRPSLATIVDESGRFLFLLGILGTIGAGWFAVSQN